MSVTFGPQPMVYIAESRYFRNWSLVGGEGSWGGPLRSSLGLKNDALK